MKKYGLLLSLIVFVISSCGDSFIEDFSPPSEKKETPLMTKGIVTTNSTSNPNLYNDWENIHTIYLNNGEHVDAPWVYNSGNSMNIPYNIRKDIKKEDGWIMLGHTLKEVKLAEPNYILFYQPKSGILKGFYFSPIPAQNSNLKWIIKSDKPSSIIPGSERIYHLADKSFQYGITSNVLDVEDTTTKGELNAGWNCFSFELPYGTIHNTNPIISITGYNVEKYEGKFEGKFGGEVIVPSTKTTNSLDSWKEHWGIVSNFSNAAKSFEDIFATDDTPPKSSVEQKSALSVIGIVSAAVSIVSNVIGAASAFTSKTENVTNRYNFGGDIQLTGQMVAVLPGLVQSINDIEINKLNNNNSLGVWGLKENPKLQIDKYGIGLSKDGPEAIQPDIKTFYRRINLKPKISKESVIINPSLLPLIKDYKVSISNIMCSLSKDQKFLYLDYKTLSEDWHCAEVPNNGWLEIEDTFNPKAYAYPGDIISHFYLSYMNTFPETYVNVAVEIEYTDGSVMASSRVFKLDGKVYDNKQDILKSKPLRVGVYFR